MGSTDTLTTTRVEQPAVVPAVPSGEPGAVPVPERKIPTPNSDLVDYLYDAMLAWTHIPSCTTEGSEDAEADKIHARCEDWEKREGEEVDHARTRFADIAHDIALAAAVEQSPYGADKNKGRMSNLVNTLAFKETGFREYVDDGRCNSRKWQATPEGIHLTRIGGTCDGTIAHSLWQIHPGGGLLLVEPTKESRDHDWMGLVDTINWGMTALRDRLEEEDQEVSVAFGHIAKESTITGENNRVLAARVAWHMAAQALRFSGFKRLCGYTGESSLGICPKGAERLDFADKWWRDHPLIDDNGS